MILPNSKSTKVCVNESDYLALIDAATDILDAIKGISENPETANNLATWITPQDIDALENALRTLGEL